MKNMVDIEVVLDQDYIEPKVTIQTREKTQQVENIIQAIDDVSNSDFPLILAYEDENIVMISQRDIVRVFTFDRKIHLNTETNTYIVKRSLQSLEELLNPERFIRISQSEIINLYKVKCFDLNSAGTIGIEFDNGEKSWVSRSRIKKSRD